MAIHVLISKSESKRGNIIIMKEKGEKFGQSLFVEDKEGKDFVVVDFSIKEFFENCK